MGELKEVLGASQEPAPLPPLEPVSPPEARAQANVTSVVVGQVVGFSSVGSRDPAGLGLSFLWRFGDGGRAFGASASHAFEAPGEFRVVLEVTNDGGAKDEAVVSVSVVAANRAPSALFSVFNGSLQTTSTEAGVGLSFNASASYDPDGDALSFLWDFGDGSSSFESSPRHAFSKPGVFTVRLKVDDGRLSNEAARVVAVNATVVERGQFAVSGQDARRHEVLVAEGARSLVAELSFPAGLGANDLRLVVFDSTGAEVGRSTAQTPPGEQAGQVRRVSLVGEALRAFASGDWSFQVERVKGVDVEYALSVRETF